MERVFASACCTIAATSTEDSTKGFLDRSSIQKSAHLSNDLYSSKLDETLTKDVERGILNQRAWALQERALSHRIIQFTSTQTYRECGSIIRTECSVDSVKDLNWLGDLDSPRTASRLLPQYYDTMFEEIFALSPSFEITKLENGPVAISGMKLDWYHITWYTKCVRGFGQISSQKSALETLQRWPGYMDEAYRFPRWESAFLVMDGVFWSNWIGMEFASLVSVRARWRYVQQ